MLKFFVALTLVKVFIAALALPTSLRTSDDEKAEELENVFQGDMVISQQELDAFNGRIDSSLLWKDNKVPYWINMTYFNAEQASHIHKAAQTINALNCLKFVNQTTEDDFISVTGEATGCSSSVGRRGGKQELKLKPAAIEVGCFRLYTIVHEFIHALGFHHMQSSYDRDHFVKIVWENIKTGSENNFVQYGTDRVTHFSVPYDYGSVMHYSETSFTSNGNATIVPIHDLSGMKMGQREKLSDKDILRIKRMYGCALVPHNV